MGHEYLTAFLTALLGLGILTLFVRRQSRIQEPLIDISLFRAAAFRGAILSDLLAVFALVGSMFALTQYLQLVLGLSPLAAGLWLIPSAVASAGSAFLAATLVRNLPAAVLVPCGLFLSATGLVSLFFLRVDSSPLAVAAALTLVSLGVGVSLTLTHDIVMSSVPAHRAGPAAALAETAYELGTALGTAILGSLLLASYRASMLASAALTALPEQARTAASTTLSEAYIVAENLDPTLGSPLIDAGQRSFTHALDLVGLVGAAVLVLAALGAARTLRGVSAHDPLVAETPDC